MVRRRRLAWLGGALIVGSASALIAQTATLSVFGEDGRQVRLSADDIAKLPRVAVTATAHGATHTFEGPLLADVLKPAGARFGELLRGPRLASYLLVEARDGYRAVFALPELDSAFTDRQIILAVTQDGQPLPADDGPWRIVVPGEKRGARWVRQVVALRVQTAPAKAGPSR